jgi:hypothetical protein
MDELFDHIRTLGTKGSLRSGMEKIGRDKFQSLVTEWKEWKIVLCDGSSARKEFEEDDLNAIAVH